MDTVRIDKWLWAARFFKTRVKATDAVTSGRVRVNGERVKPARKVISGDVVEVAIGEAEWTVRVRGVAEKRGSAAIAAGLYDETAESAAARKLAAETRETRAPGAGRPTKQDRRRINALRGARTR